MVCVSKLGYQNGENESLSLTVELTCAQLVMEKSSEIINLLDVVC